MNRVRERENKEIGPYNIQKAANSCTFRATNLVICLRWFYSYFCCCCYCCLFRYIFYNFSFLFCILFLTNKSTWLILCLTISWLLCVWIQKMIIIFYCTYIMLRHKHVIREERNSASSKSNVKYGKYVLFCTAVVLHFKTIVYADFYTRKSSVNVRPSGRQCWKVVRLIEKWQKQ